MGEVQGAGGGGVWGVVQSLTMQTLLAYPEQRERRKGTASKEIPTNFGGCFLFSILSFRGSVPRTALYFTWKRENEVTS